MLIPVVIGVRIEAEKCQKYIGEFRFKTKKAKQNENNEAVVHYKYSRAHSLVKMMKRDGEEAVCLPVCTLLDDSLRDC